MKRVIEPYWPREPRILAALQTDPASVKVIIIGQDPYPNKNDASGHAFSTGTKKITKSLQCIYQALGINPGHGDLGKWIGQGVVLLNSALTFTPGRDADYWAAFVTDVIARHQQAYPDTIVLAWGRDAQRIRAKNVITDVHPMAGIYNPNTPFTRQTFDAVNARLTELGKVPIDWTL